MTEETNGAGPDLIVLGMDEAGKPKAARFPSGHGGSRVSQSTTCS